MAVFMWEQPCINVWVQYFCFEGYFLVWILAMSFLRVCWSVGSQCEELRPWQRSWGGSLAYAKAWSSLRKPPVPEHLPQNQSTLRGLSPTTISLREGVNLQLQLIKIPGRDKSFNLRTLKVLWPSWSGSSGHMRLFTASQLWEARDVFSKYRLFWEVRRSLV